MKIYEYRDQKSSFSCNYCWEQGHRINKCHHLKKHYEEFKALNTELHTEEWYAYQPDTTGMKNHRAKNRHTLKMWLGDYIKNGKCEKYFGKPQAKAKVTRKQSHCGFCGSADHNRRNCSVMTEFKSIYEQANKVYRKAFYDLVVRDYGFGAGAMIEFKSYGEKSIGLVTRFDAKTIGIGNLRPQWSEYYTGIRYDVSADGKNLKFKFNSPFRFDHKNASDYLDSDKYAYDKICRNLFVNYDDSWWKDGNIEQIVCPSPNRMTEEWFNGQSEPIDYVMKKRKAFQLWAEFGDTIVKLLQSDAEFTKRIEKFRKSYKY